MRRARIRCSALLCLIAACSSQAQPVFNVNPARVVGHPSLVPKSAAPNVVEGRELFNPQSVALDLSLSPPALYVADTGNNRVLGWRNATSFGNGAFADIVIGQRDKLSTAPLGPGTTLRTGLNQPTGLAVDSQGNLYVVDTGNNRILRFPKPFEQQEELKQPDLVIGQPDLDGNRANGGGNPSATTIATVSRGAPFRTALLFDGSGNLYFSDAGNHRVLRYPAAALSARTNGPAADLVLGQFNFTSNTGLPISDQNRINKSGLNSPSGLAMDLAGRLYVADALSRVLVYVPSPNLASGMAASRILGIVVVQQGQPAPPAVNDTGLRGPEGVLMIGPNPAVVDTGNNRILVYDRFENWPPESPMLISPPARSVIGQADMNSARARAGNDGLAGPIQAVFSGAELFVADAGNNRVLVLPPPFANASRVLGQTNFDGNAPNYIEGKELFLYAGLTAAAGTAAVDTKSNPPRLYVADTWNNRVLGYRDARKVKPGDPADIVIGQPNLLRSVPNYPTNDANQRSEVSLLFPTGLAVDAAGNLWVADTGNSRVLRFPKPSFDPPGNLPQANLVLGQSSFYVRNTDPTRRTMGAPYGLAFSPEGHLFVSDVAHNRVLLFLKPPEGDFSSGMEATAHFGQPDFTTSSPGTDNNRMNGPRGIALDTSARLYVADTGNNRVVIYSQAPIMRPGDDPSPAFVLTASTSASVRLRNPFGVAVSPITGEIWVTDTAASRILRYPEYSFLPASNAANGAIPSNGPLAVTLDVYGNPIVAESVNRVAMFYPAAAGVSAANFFNRPVAPGMYVALFPSGGQFAFEETKVFDELPNPIPMPKELADVQVLINDQPAPLHFVSPRQINFFMPMNAPTSGTVDVLVTRPSTGQVFASGALRMDVASPGLFTANASGSGQLAALNQDSSVNSPSNPAPRGSVVQLFGTGQGFVPGAPPDGDTPGGRQILTEEKARVFIGTDFVPDSDVTYSGLAPNLIGVWQINFRIPSRVAPGPAVLVFVQIKDRNSMPSPQLRGTIAVSE